MAQESYASLPEQVASSLRDGIHQGKWKGEMPGRNTLAQQLGVNHKTVEAALKLLEKEGLLKRQGVGRGRKIRSGRKITNRPLRVSILAYDKTDLNSPYLLDLVHRLQTSGYSASFAGKTLVELGMDVKRVARFAEKEDADAWVIQAGSRGILDWFAQHTVPAFALFGRAMHVDLANAAPLKAPAYEEIVESLVALGHQRISLLCRSDRRRPSPGFLEQHFLNLLEQHGIRVSSYNLPDWDDTPSGFRDCLDSLFQLTPPTALLISEVPLFIAAQQHLASKGIFCPQDVSMICSDYNDTFDWCHPSVSHIHWDAGPIVLSVMRWVKRLSAGENPRRKFTTKAKFVSGGTIGQAPRTSK